MIILELIIKVPNTNQIKRVAELKDRKTQKA